jgi:hypothetical protein
MGQPLPATPTSLANRCRYSEVRSPAGGWQRSLHVTLRGLSHRLSP